MRRCGNNDCRECPTIRVVNRHAPYGSGYKIKHHSRRRGVSPLPWRVNKDQEIIDNQGNTVAWGYHEDLGHLFDKIRVPDAYLIRLVNSWGARHERRVR